MACLQWEDMWREKRDKLDLLASAARQLIYADAIACLAQWQDHAKLMIRTKTIIQRAIGAASKVKEFKAFSTWLTYVTEYVRVNNLIQRTVASLQNLTLHKGFDTWVHNLYGSRPTASHSFIVRMTRGEPEPEGESEEEDEGTDAESADATKPDDDDWENW